MRFVLYYRITNDDYDSFDIHEPFEYESKESFIVHFEEELKRILIENKNGNFPDFKIAGLELDAANFRDVQYIYKPKGKRYIEKQTIKLPEVYTLDEWWEKFRAK